MFDILLEDCVFYASCFVVQAICLFIIFKKILTGPLTQTEIDYGEKE